VVSSALSVGNEGCLLSPSLVYQSLVEHFHRWAKILGSHGLIVLEAHCLPARIAHEFLYQTENLHFDALQGFSLQHLTEADEFLLAAAESSLFPCVPPTKWPPNLPFTRLTLTHFVKRPFLIRKAVKADLDQLLILERECWPKHLRATRRSIDTRLQRPYQYVLSTECSVVAVLYTMRLSSPELIFSKNVHEIEDFTSETGSTLLLLSLNVLPEKQNQGFGGVLLDFVIQLGRLQAGITAIRGVTRCRDTSKHRVNDFDMSRYIQQRTTTGLTLDRTLRFHEQHGASILQVVPHFRPSDLENDGHGVLISYECGEAKRHIIDKSPVHKQISQHLRESTVIRAFQTILGESYQSSASFMSLGLDSMDLMELRSLLSQGLGESLAPEFLFEFPTPAAVLAHLCAAPADIVDNNRPSQHNNCNSHSRVLTEERVAVVGLACRFPGAKNADEFWYNLVQGLDSVVKTNRWTSNDGPVEGGFIENIEMFDAAFFGIGPVEACAMDPQQRLLLEVTYEALEHAGISPSSIYGQSVGVFAGCFSEEYKELAQRSHGEKSAFFGVGTSAAAVAGRVAYHFGTHGPAMTVNTACSSSLVAIHLARHSLLRGECKLALASGVNVILSPKLSKHFEDVHMLSPSGRCKTFDASADGYVRSEGCGVVILKRESLALQDGDNILAVLDSSVVNQDGRSSLITSPNPQAQRDLLRASLLEASRLPSEIDYLETHGTGTRLGDPIEINAIVSIYGERLPSDRPLYLGALKASVGHMEAAAGVGGLIKVILALSHETIPKQLHVDSINPEINLKPGVLIVRNNIPWKPCEGRVRVGGVSSFGFTGTNAHLLVSEHRRHLNDVRRPSKYCWLSLSAKSETALTCLVEKWCLWLASAYSCLETFNESFSFTSNVGRDHFQHRVGVAMLSDSTSASIAAALRDTFATRSAETSISNPKAALVFGPYSDTTFSFEYFYSSEPSFRRAWEHASTLFAVELQPFSLDEFRDQLFASLAKSSVFTPLSHFACSYALAQWWLTTCVPLSCIIAFEECEIVGRVIAGIWSLHDAIRLLVSQLPHISSSIGAEALSLNNPCKDIDILHSIEFHHPRIPLFFFAAEAFASDSKLENIVRSNTSASDPSFQTID